MYGIVAGCRSRLRKSAGRHPSRAVLLLLCGLARSVPAPLAAADELTGPAPSEAAALFGHQHLRQILAERLPNLSADAVEQITHAFEEHLRRTSRIQAENFQSGRMDDAELVSRVSVFLADHPNLLGRSPAPGNDPLSKVQAVLAARAITPPSPAERIALAERFLRNLSERNRFAHQNLVAGRMNDDELASRLAVFLEDLRTEAANAPGTDAAQTAAAELVAEQFVRQNFGGDHERATTLVYRCTITDADTGRVQPLRVMRKSPNRVRLHLVADDIVTLALASDGTAAWLQRPAKAGEDLVGEQAASLLESAAFDHPLIGYKERGARLSLTGGGHAPFELTLRETDGRTVVSVIDPLTYEESVQRLVNVAGRVSELRLRDYRRAGVMNIPCTQELWREGQLRLTTRLEEPSTEAVLLDELFRKPASSFVGYMDYMGGLAVLQARRARAAAGAPAAPVSPAPVASP